MTYDDFPSSKLISVASIACLEITVICGQNHLGQAFIKVSTNVSKGRLRSLNSSIVS